MLPNKDSVQRWLSSKGPGCDDGRGKTSVPGAQSPGLKNVTKS